MVAPERGYLGWVMITVAMLGIVAIAAQQAFEQLGGRRDSGGISRVISLYGMLISAASFAGFAAVYWWSEHRDKPRSAPIASVVADIPSEEHSRPAGSTGIGALNPNISFQKLAVFWVETAKDTYQVSVVAKFFNAGSQAYIVNSLSFDGKKWSFFPRGSYHLRQLFQNAPQTQVIEDNYLKPATEAYFKMQMPIVFDMTINGGATPDFVLRGGWKLNLSGIQVAVDVPKLYSVYPKPISEVEWRKLGKAESQLKIEELDYVEFPPAPPAEAPMESRIIYNKNRGATFSNPYYAQTPAQRGEAGVMIFVRGKGAPPLQDGWETLGATYSEVWSDPHKLRIYNSICPPDADGNLRAFGFIAGAEAEMSGPMHRQLAAPTTRAADILDFAWP